MVNNVQDSGSTAALFAQMNATAQAGSSSATSTAAETEDRFLTLLITQMKNQDPLNPMDNAEVTSQMAQLSTVTGIEKLNTTLQALSDNMMPNQSLQAATSMIGHGVFVPGNGIEKSDGSGYGGIELTQSAENVEISIHDQSGALVRNINLGAQSVGLVNWQWDGRNEAGVVVADGSYTFAVTAKQAGEPVDATALQFGMVNSVMQDNQGVTLNVGQRDGIALSQVRQIL